jgi:hypothetical protein
MEVQSNGRIRRWAFIPEVGKHLRVVTEPDGETVHKERRKFMAEPAILEVFSDYV